MSWLRFLRRSRWDAERASEIDAYLTAETTDNIARGMPPAEAHAAARPNKHCDLKRLQALSPGVRTSPGRNCLSPIGFILTNKLWD